MAPWRLFLWETRMSTAWLAVRLGCSRRAVEDDRLALAERALVGCPVHGCGASLRCENDGWFGRAKSSTRGSSTHLANPDPTVRSQREEIGPESILIESSIRLCSHSPGSVSRRRCDAEEGLESQSPGNWFLSFLPLSSAVDDTRHQNPASSSQPAQQQWGQRGRDAERGAAGLICEEKRRLQWRR